MRGEDVVAEEDTGRDGRDIRTERTKRDQQTNDNGQIPDC